MTQQGVIAGSLPIVQLTAGEVIAIAEASFRGEQWKIAHDEERELYGDVRLDDITLESALREDERWIDTWEHCERIRSTGNVALGIHSLEALWQHPELIPETW